MGRIGVSRLLKTIRYGLMRFKISQNDCDKKRGPEDLREITLSSKYMGPEKHKREKSVRNISLTELEIQMLLKSMGLERDIRRNLIETLFKQEI